jgi:hypothetical protein
VKKNISEAEFVNESVEYFNERIDKILSHLHESALSSQQKTVLENEKQIILD